MIEVMRIDGHVGGGKGFDEVGMVWFGDAERRDGDKLRLKYIDVRK
jgi:hypothetical protein